jgi:hypothetical protein
MSDEFQTGLADWRRGVRWFAAEFLVVVCGILVALTLQSWWNDRAARLQEQALLQRFRTELVGNRARYLEAAEAQNRIIESARTVLQWTGPKAGVVDAAEFESHVAELLGPLPTYRAATSELDAMLGSGQLVLIRNDELRAKIAAWPPALQRLRRTEDILMDEVIDEFYPYAVERIPLINLDVGAGIIVGQPRSKFERNYEAVLRDVQFENHVENRWYNGINILNRMEAIRAVEEEIIRLIEAELSD